VTKLAQSQSRKQGQVACQRPASVPSAAAFLVLLLEPGASMT